MLINNKSVFYTRYRMFFFMWDIFICKGTERIAYIAYDEAGGGCGKLFMRIFRTGLWCGGMSCQSTKLWHKKYNVILSPGKYERHRVIKTRSIQFPFSELNKVLRIVFHALLKLLMFFFTAPSFCGILMKVKKKL